MRSFLLIFTLAAFLPVHTASAGIFGQLKDDIRISNKPTEEQLRLYTWGARFNDALTLAEDLIRKDDPAGYYAKGFLYQHGWGVEKDFTKAIDLYNKAIAHEYGPALARLGEMYIRNEGGLSGAEKGVVLIQRGVATEHPRAYVALASLYATGKGLQKDYVKARTYYEMAAAKEYPSAYWQLARMYHFGHGVEKDESKADSYARKAAEQKQPDAVVWLADKYMREDSRRTAYDLLEAPVKLKLPRAEAMMGWLLLYGGKKVNAKPEQGLMLLKSSAEKGNAGAMHDLGVAYENGKGVSRSNYLAGEWYSKAASAHIKDENREGAIRSFERLEKVDPKNKTVGELRAKLGVGGGSDGSAGDVNEGQTTGTGWMIEPGYVVTNNHVVEGSTSIRVAFDNGTTYAARVKSADKNNDLAILEVIGAPKLPAAIPLARASMSAGARVFAIGFPITQILGSEPKVTDGIISSTRGYLDDPRTYQISVPVQAGNSGSPLLNMKGEVVGVVTSKLAAVNVFKYTGDLPQNVNYAVKSDYVSILTKSLKRTSNVEKLGNQESSLDVVAERVRGSIVQIITK